MAAFYVLSVLGSGFTIWMAVEAIRRGQAGSWLWVILFFGPVGAAVYFFSEYTSWPLRRFAFQRRQVTAHELRQAEADVRRLDSAPAWFHYASLLRSRNDFARAASAARKAVERDGGHLDARYELGQALLGAGQFKEAAEMLESVVRVDRTHDKDYALYALAQAHVASGDPAAARPLLAELEGRSSRPPVLYDRAVLEAQMGDRETAARCLRRILDEAEYVPPYLAREVKPWVKKAKQALRRLGY
jgi:tetratricopeptide (TPR) repeat protein